MLQKHQSYNHFHRSGLETDLSDHHQEIFVINQEILDMNEHSYGWFVDIELNYQTTTVVKDIANNHRKILEQRKRKRVDDCHQARIILQQCNKFGTSSSVDDLTLKILNGPPKRSHDLDKGLDWSQAADIVDNNVLSDTHIHVIRTQKSWNSL